MGRRKPECVCEWGDTSLPVICATHARLCVMCAFDDIRPIVIRVTILMFFVRAAIYCRSYILSLIP